jgi:hypothetical protein
MTQTPPQTPGPPSKFWDTLPQIIGKLKNEFLLVTLGILILVVAIGVFASGVVEDLGRAFFYLLVVLAWLAYLIGRVLDAWTKHRPLPELPDRSVQASPPGSQTSIGQSEGPVLSGTFHGPVTVGPQPTPSAPAPTTTPPDADQSELVRLHQVLSTRFDQEELRTLCFKLGVAYDDLRGEGRDAKARELVGYMHRRGELDRLRAAIEAERP